MRHDTELGDMLKEIDELPGMDIQQEQSKTRAEHLKFEFVDQELGEKLLAPIRGACQKETIGDWRYSFCLGKQVDHVHINDKKEYYVMGKASINTTESELIKMNIKMNDELKGLREFLGPQIIDQQMPNYTYKDTYQYDEEVILDEDGLVFKVTIEPNDSDTFNKNQLTEKSGGLVAMVNRKLTHSSILSLSLKKKAEKYANLYTPTELSRWTQEMVVSSQDVDHYEIMFFVY
jgi:hypothetical protein